MVCRLCREPLGHKGDPLSCLWSVGYAVRPFHYIIWGTPCILGFFDHGACFTPWFHRNSIFLWISTKISIGRRFWSNGQMDWLQVLLIMLIILKSRSERKEFSWLQRFRWFWSSFSSNFYGIEIPWFHKIRCRNRYLRACIECVETSADTLYTIQYFHQDKNWTEQFFHQCKNFTEQVCQLDSGLCSRSSEV
jgi:hypothetical protein